MLNLETNFKQLEKIPNFLLDSLCAINMNK